VHNRMQHGHGTAVLPRTQAGRRSCHRGFSSERRLTDKESNGAASAAATSQSGPLAEAAAAAPAPGQTAQGEGTVSAAEKLLRGLQVGPAQCLMPALCIRDLESLLVSSRIPIYMKRRHM